MTGPAPEAASGEKPEVASGLPAYVALHAERALGGVTRADGELPVELVHDARTSLRRLRATLRTLPGAFEDAAQAEAALQHLALTLGAVRDVDVLAELLPAALDRVSADRSIADGSTAVGHVSTGGRKVAHALFCSTFEDMRARAVAAYLREAAAAAWADGVGLLRRWVEDPPPAPLVDAEGLLAEAEQRVVERLRAAHGEISALHTARKAAKRWRYAAELLEGAPAAAEHLARAEQLQELLGEVQDLEIAVELLGQLQDRPAAAAALPALSVLVDDLRERQRSAIIAALAAEDLYREEITPRPSAEPGA